MRLGDTISLANIDIGEKIAAHEIKDSKSIVYIYIYVYMYIYILHWLIALT